MSHYLEVVHQYLRQKHESIVEGYCIAGRKETESCGDVACAIARKLVQGGYKPYLLKVLGTTQSGTDIRTRVVPRLYNGRVHWGSHFACAEQGMVYDPLVGFPVPFVTYSTTTFVYPVEILIRVSQAEIVGFINKGRDRPLVVPSE